MSFIKHTKLALAIFSAGISSGYANEPVSVAPLIDQPISFQAVIGEVALDSNNQFTLGGETLSFSEVSELFDGRIQATGLVLTIDGIEQGVESDQVNLLKNTLDLSAIQGILSETVGSYAVDISFDIRGQQLTISLDQEITQLGDDFTLQLDDDWQARALSLDSHLNGRPIPLSELMVVINNNTNIGSNSISVSLDESNFESIDARVMLDASGLMINNINPFLSTAQNHWTGCFTSLVNQGDLKICVDSQLLPDRYLVKLERNAQDATAIQRVAQTLGRQYNIEIKYIYGHVFFGFSATLDAADVQRLESEVSVLAVLRDNMMYTQTIQNPTPSWGQDRIDERPLQLDSRFTYDDTGAGVNAYIIDSGINAAHPDFAGRLGTGASFVAGLPNPFEDCIDHGTHVAGTAAGTTFGVAKGAEIHSVRVFGCAPTTPTSVIIAGVNWVTANGVLPAVVNMSLGGAADTAMDTAVQDSIDAGFTYVVAAGNSNADACNFSPARVNDAITTGASQSNDKRWKNWWPWSNSGSNKGSCVDVFAPGKDIVSADAANLTGTRTLTGTSMAAPHVTGIAALLLQDQPTASPATIFNQVISTATSGVLSSIGSGSPNRLAYWKQACTDPVTLFNASLLNPWFDGANCYVMPVPAGGTNPFVWGNSYYIDASFTDCPLGSYDGANCYFMPKPTNGFVYANNFYTTYDDCSIGSNDGANCFIAAAPAGTTPFIYAGNFYYSPLPGSSCPVGWFDGANCYVMSVPAGGFIYANNFYSPYNDCSIGSNDGANCFIAAAPAGTTAFTYSGNFYTTTGPAATCIYGSYDGAHCYIGTAPTGSSAFLWSNNFYYAD